MGMTPREFLIGWLLEFGGREINDDELYNSSWYMGKENDIDVDSPQIYVDDELGRGLMKVTSSDSKWEYPRRYQITAKGLKFIEGGSE